MGDSSVELDEVPTLSDMDMNPTSGHRRATLWVTVLLTVHPTPGEGADGPAAERKKRQGLTDTLFCCGGREMSPPQQRDWTTDNACLPSVSCTAYSDPDVEYEESWVET